MKYIFVDESWESSPSPRMSIPIIGISIFFGFALFLNSCKKDSSQLPTETAIDPKLLGVWTSDAWGKKLAFKENHEFVDSEFFPTISPHTLTFVVKGHFSIKDGYIQSDNVAMIYYYKSSDSTMLTAMFYSYPSIKINSLFWSKLELIPTMILTPEGSTNPTQLSGKLSGNWSTNMLVSAFDRDQNPQLVSGNDQREYMFSADSSWYSVNHILQYGKRTENYNWGSIPYIFTAPNDLMLGGEEVKISIKNRLMYLESYTQYFNREYYY